ncbi:MAG TPA: NAD-dependent epimerase/dehydratase family protein [Hyphomonadaceae bacterium]|jgi:nucleoside-diphosphate-sugar epimerase|nr:NAD-dependent epimerase/dehydratase family protein [Hyphomonadaceae bacterium]
MTNRQGLITIFGYGPTGIATADALRARGQAVRVVQRKRPANLPAGIEFMPCDVMDAQSVLRAMTGAEQAVISIGVEYSGKVWKEVWPKAMANFLAAAEATSARIVHIDNMYMYGPHSAEPINEDAPLTSYGQKPAVRAEATRMWMKAGREGRVKWAALRAPDFYGPGVDRSHIGETGLGLVAQGKMALLIPQPDQPHDYAYVPDIARAAVSLLDAPDDVFNQVWHVPCAPTRTSRQILQMGADAIGAKLKFMPISTLMLRMMGVFSPFLRECIEMRFTWNRPYIVDATKFSRRFWSDATPFEVGIPLTVKAFRAAAPAKTKESRGQTPARTATP